MIENKSNNNNKMATRRTLIGDNGNGPARQENLYREEEPDVGRLSWQELKYFFGDN